MMKMITKEKQKTNKRLEHKKRFNTRTAVVKKNRKLLFENHKRTLGIGFTIFTNSTIIGYTPSFTCKGVRIPLDIGKYFQIPKNQAEHFDIKVTYEFASPSGAEKLVDVISKVYLEKVEYPNRKKIKILRSVVYLKPNDVTLYQKLRDREKNSKRIRYTIHNQFKPTNYFLEIRNIRNATPDDFDLEGLELITEGGRQKAQFEIYRNEENKLFVKTKTSIRKWGKVTLSSELRNHITDFFTYNQLVCKKDNAKPMIISTFPRVIGKRAVFEIRFPHFVEAKMDTTIIFTHPNFRLTEIAKKDYQITRSFREMGYPIKSFYSLFFNGHHDNYKVEKMMRALIQRAFFQANYKIHSDVQISFNNPQENNLGNKHAFDDLILNTNDDSLILVEYKTSFGTNAKHREIDYAIAELFHYQRKLGKTVVLVLLVNEDLYNNNKRLTRQFGEDIKIVLVGKHELMELYQKPSLLIDRINSVKERLKNKPKGNDNYQTTPLFKSLLKLPLSIKKIIDNNKSIFFTKIPNHFSFYTTLTVNNSGAEFEQEVYQILSNEGFEVAPNLVISYYNRRMEIDLIAFRDEELVVISCRNALNVTCHKSFRIDIKQKVCKIEYRKFLLNADTAKLYLKVTPETYLQVKEFEGTWIDSVEIIFVLN